MDFPSPSSTSHDTTAAAFLCGWINDDVVYGPHHIDVDGGACGEQYEQGLDDSATLRLRLRE